MEHAALDANPTSMLEFLQGMLEKLEDEQGAEDVEGRRKLAILQQQAARMQPQQPPHAASSSQAASDDENGPIGSLQPTESHLDSRQASAWDRQGTSGPLHESQPGASTSSHGGKGTAEAADEFQVAKQIDSLNAQLAILEEKWAGADDATKQLMQESTSRWLQK
ncbi:hypothetical protein WJX74_005772 [Apatococcus lobatus]|uniref:Uncharacterized protein n=1 Tax=Apatococcus lobatus TaxID=904363 RepID=A0AAW1QUJ7_9CHLO